MLLQLLLVLLSITSIVVVLGISRQVLSKQKGIEKNYTELSNEVRFLLNEVANVNEQLRYQALGSTQVDKTTTLESFNYQWKNLTTGLHLPSHPEFMKNVQDQIVSYTGLPKEWFKGKKVIDIGCGLGRFTYGLLSLGAEVTACDNSEFGCEYTKNLCEEFKDRLHLVKANIIQDKLPTGFDLVWCYGVVHHTGNTYLAIKKACEAAKQGGHVFFMIYGYPEKPIDFVEVNSYEALRDEFRNLSFEEKVEGLKKRFPPEHVHGYFDAISPTINDLLTFPEVTAVLNQNQIKNVKRMNSNRNLHVVGVK